MSWKTLGLTILVGIIGSPLFAAPTLSVTPGGIQSGNWVWNVSVSPDLPLAGGTTPLAVELGFRLTTAPLLSVTNVNPIEWNTALPGKAIFGWEIGYQVLDPITNQPTGTSAPDGIEVNCTGCTVTNAVTAFPGTQASTIVTGTNNEIFAAMGSIVFTTPGPKSFLQIVTQGPGNGGPSSSTIQWLGSAAGGQGRIAQIVGGQVGQNFDVYSGSATQAFVPEPASCALLAIGTIAMGIARVRYRSKCSNRC
jgi:hypothetical protein